MSQLKTMGVIVDQIFYFDGKEYSTDETLVSFTESFSIYFNKIVFIGRVMPGKGPYTLNSKKCGVIALPFYSSLYQVYRHYSALRRAARVIFSNNRYSIDVFWLRGPHPVSIWIAEMCRKHGKPYFLMVGQNLYDQVKMKPPAVKKYLGLAYITLLERRYRHLAKKSLTFTVGRDLCNRYSNGNNMVIPITSSIVDKETILRSMKNHKKHINTTLKRISLLSVGRIEPEKGHIYLIDAFSSLYAKNNLIYLIIAGTGSYEKRLRQYTEKKGLSDHVEFTGYIPFGPQLESLYRSSDIFILPSLGGEGFPRVIIEAMAFGLPVITTKDGGIPFLLCDNVDALLIESKSSSAIVHSVNRLLSDRRLRNRLINNAFRTILSYSNENQRDLLFKNIIRFYPHLAT